MSRRFPPRIENPVTGQRIVFRRLDSIFILQTNQDSGQLSTQEAVAAYRQLMEVERAFIVGISLVVPIDCCPAASPLLCVSDPMAPERRAAV